MKKKILALVSVILSAYFCIAFTACGKDKVTFKNDADGGVESVIFTASSNVLKLEDDTTLEDYINALKEKGELQFEASSSPYGLFIQSVNGRENVTDQDGTHGFSWAVYTNLVELDGVVYSSSEYGTYKVDNETTLNSASYGVSGLPCIEGYTYALVYAEWSW